MGCFLLALLRKIMGGVSHSISWWWDYFRGLFNIKSFSVDGTITLGPGQQVIDVPTAYPHPSSVFLSLEEPDDCIPTCVGNLNWAATKVNANGFTLFADIKTTSCTINYVIEYNSGINPGGKE